MKNARPYVLSIAGFDPSGGAGVLADVKTFENYGVYGMGVVSALTVQNDVEFDKVEWLNLSQILEQTAVLKKRFNFGYIKIGLIKDLELLYELVAYLKTDSKIIWDPILKASAGYEFHSTINKKLLEDICKQLYLITPNIPEVLQLGGFNNAEKNATYLSSFCNVYLKGGHDNEDQGKDILFTTDGKNIVFKNEGKQVFPKHGSGCVLSAAITANLAKGMNLESACGEAKIYITDFLSSNDSLLGYHLNKVTVENE